jgi:predicted phospho-2-dehydro-3-deoxyheptonate aldolase
MQKGNMTGKLIRLSRLTDLHSGRMFILPMDHGLSTWPLEGFDSVAVAAARLRAARLTALLVHKGQVAHLAPAATEARHALIVHLSGATCWGPDENDKRTVASVEHALKLGADAVSIQVNVGTPGEPHMLEELGRVSEECHAWGLPLLAMMYARGAAAEHGWEAVAHAARIAAELGADVVKTLYTGSIETFRQVVQGAGVPIVIGGGPKIDSDLRLLETIADSLRAGASGVCIGRNLFQHEDPTLIAEAAGKVLHDNVAPAKALESARANAHQHSENEMVRGR